MQWKSASVSPTIPRSFNSLFVGMGLAMQKARKTLFSGWPFQFPFRRDGPCNYNQAGYVMGVKQARFNSLFIGMGLAIQGIHERDLGLCPSFQFPFHRDGPCNSVVAGTWVRTVHFRFNSLFIGMGLAIHEAPHRYEFRQAFQFPFHRDGPCNILLSSSLDSCRSRVSIPFSSGWALQSSETVLSADEKF